MTRKKKGHAPKRKPVVRRKDATYTGPVSGAFSGEWNSLGTVTATNTPISHKVEPTLIETTFPDGGKMFTILPPKNSDKAYVYTPPSIPLVLASPSRWSRVVAWVRATFLNAEWMRCPAPWWRFWNPMSGLKGGLVAGLVLAVMVIAFYG